VAASTNYDFLVPCTQPGCLSSSPTQDSLSTNTCASMEHSPLMALRISDIHSINRHPGIYYSKIKSQTIFNSFMAYLIGILLSNLTYHQKLLWIIQPISSPLILILLQLSP